MLLLGLGSGAVCIITSVVGSFFVKLGADQGIMRALYKGLIATGLLSILGIAFVMYALVGLGTSWPMTSGGSVTGWNLLLCAIVGLAVTGFIVWITEYYTATQYRPGRSVAQSSTTGHGTHVIQGLPLSLEATALPVIGLSLALILSY